MRVLVLMRLGNALARHYIRPLLQAARVDEVILVRHAPIAVESPRLRQVTHDVGLSNDVTRQSRRAAMRNLLAVLRSGLREARGADAVAAFNLMPYGVLAWLVARVARRPSVLCLIGTDFNVWLSRPLAGPLLRAVLRRADAVCAFGDEACNALEGMGVARERLYVLPNTIDTDVFVPAEPPEPDTDLVYVGYLRPGKRVDLVLETLAALHRDRPKTTLLVVGEGSEREALQQQAERLGLRAAVEFFGPTADVVSQLHRGRVFISLSEREGLPLAMLEAMAAGLPVVVTDVGAIRTAVRPGASGYLVPSPADPAEAARAVLRLLDDPAHLAAARASAIEAGRQHGYDRAAAVWDDVLDELRASSLERRAR